MIKLMPEVLADDLRTWQWIQFDVCTDYSRANICWEGVLRMCENCVCGSCVFFFFFTNEDAAEALSKTTPGLSDSWNQTLLRLSATLSAIKLAFVQFVISLPQIIGYSRYSKNWSSGDKGHCGIWWYYFTYKTKWSNRKSLFFPNVLKVYTPCSWGFAVFALQFH